MKGFSGTRSCYQLGEIWVWEGVNKVRTLPDAPQSTPHRQPLISISISLAHSDGPLQNIYLNAACILQIWINAFCDPNTKLESSYF